ncbi:hypothetical protein PI125_g19690 [Phytophthora idaei]|nr:hypothetical protein PI125_g19690 [Phytophthora idaei]
MSATKRYTATISLSICTIRSLYVTTGSYAGLPSPSYLGVTAALDAAAASPHAQVLLHILHVVQLLGRALESRDGCKIPLLHIRAHGLCEVPVLLLRQLLLTPSLG